MDITQAIDLMREVNMAQIAAIGFMIWSMYSRLDAKIEKLDTKIDRLSDRVNEMDKRLCRLEGTISAGSCALKKVEEKKAE